MLKQKSGWNLDNSYHQLSSFFYSEQKPMVAKEPELILFNEPLAELLSLSIDELKSEEGVEILAGNELPNNAQPIAQAYSGHQFGQFTMLGDGRAILLGEQITNLGERFDIQLKGAGKTIYSRGGDGRAVLGPVLREYLVSEAMHALGIPTTRALAAVKTGNPVYREDIEEGAVLTRVAKSHIRVGTFQYAASWGTETELKQFVDYTIERHFPSLFYKKNPYLSLLKRVIRKQAKLIVKWQLIGFVHGVMNTDNMTISGETIDYGPCAFIDRFDPKAVFSSIDRSGRYRYENQPAIGAWNLTRFAETLIPLIDEDEEKAISLAKDVLMEYKTLYENMWLSGMRKKIGLLKEKEADEQLINDLLTIMEEEKRDYTNTFIYLTELDEERLLTSNAMWKWYRRWQERLEDEEKLTESIQAVMRNNNPSIIPRNYYVEQALQKANDGDFSFIKAFIQELSNPYAYTDEQKKYQHIPATFKHYRTFCGT